MTEQFYKAIQQAANATEHFCKDIQQDSNRLNSLTKQFARRPTRLKSFTKIFARRPTGLNSFTKLFARRPTRLNSFTKLFARRRYKTVSGQQNVQWNNQCQCRLTLTTAANSDDWQLIKSLRTMSLNTRKELMNFTFLIILLQTTHFVWTNQTRLHVAKELCVRVIKISQKTSYNQC